MPRRAAAPRRYQGQCRIPYALHNPILPHPAPACKPFLRLFSSLLPHPVHRFFSSPNKRRIQNIKIYRLRESENLLGNMPSLYFSSKHLSESESLNRQLWLRFFTCLYVRRPPPFRAEAPYIYRKTLRLACGGGVLPPLPIPAGKALP